MSYRYPDRAMDLSPSRLLYPNPHKGFTSFQRFRGDRLNKNWAKERGWLMEHLPEDLFRLPPETEEYYPDTTIAYFRIPWAALEPEEGKIDLSLPERILNEAHRRGQHVLLRFPPHDARPGELDLPLWFRQKWNLPPREIGDKTTPDVPGYYDAYCRLVRTLGERFNGDPRVTAVDVSLVGAWGEGAQADMLSEEKWKSLTDAHLQAFSETPLMGQYLHPESIHYANTVRPVGFRADCVGNMPKHMAFIYPRLFAQYPDVWKTAPVAFESCWVPQYWKTMGWDYDEVIEQTLKWHVTCFNAKSVAIPPEWKEKTEEWIKKMGYRFALRRAEYPSEAAPGDKLQFGFWIENRGAAPIYHPYPFLLRLRGEHAAITLPLEADITKWLPGDSICDVTVDLPRLPAGNYIPEVGLQKENDKIFFASQGEVTDGFLRIGEYVTVTE